MFGKKRSDFLAITETFKEAETEYHRAQDALQPIACAIALGKMLTVCRLASRLGFKELASDLSRLVDTAINEQVKAA